ncbi:MAG: hypothetical protein ACUVVU_07115 [Tepidimonas sp.]|uniref:hypothetical protein n=1 Tax=Tepidimonas sp. TaxID=2002775 RepID=UPI004054FAE9
MAAIVRRPLSGCAVPFAGARARGLARHSGLQAIRQSIAAGVNITCRILYTDAVAMTGGQPVGDRPQGHSVLQIVHSLRAEGVRKL